MKRLTLILAMTFITISALKADIVWHSADSLPLLGKCIDPESSSMRYQRLPDSLQHIVKRPALYGLGRHSAGMSVRFRSNAPAIHARWKSVFKSSMNQMSPAGTRGLDLYTLQDDSTWVFVNSARPDLNQAVTETLIMGNMEPKEREYILYMSLYDGVDSLYVGVPQGYEVSQPHIDLPRLERPIVYYGTSLVHGGCVNRPGMAHSNQLGRRFGRNVINLGFGGNGQLDLEIARVIAATKDPELVILDFVANCSSGQIDTLMVPFVDVIRQSHPDVPILVMECMMHPRCSFDSVMRDATLRHNAMLRRRYDDLIKRYDNLYYIPSDSLRLGTEHTVDALHLTDHGAILMTDAMTPFIARILNTTGQP